MSLDPVTAVADAAAEAAKLALQKDAELNTPAEIAARQAQQVQDLREDILEALEKGDLDEIRRLCA